MSRDEIIALIQGIATRQESIEAKLDTLLSRRRPSRGKGTLEECQSWATEKGFPATDGEHFFNEMEAGGWMRGKNTIKNWKAHSTAWSKQGYLLSQRGQTNQPRPKLHI